MQTSNPFTAEIEIKPQTSWLLIVFVALVHTATFLLILVLPGIELWVQCLVWLALLLSLAHFFSHYFGYQANRADIIFWREFGGWEIITAAAEHLPVILSDSSFSSLHVTVLNFSTRKTLGKRRFTVILLPDNCDLSIRRRLRMRMKLSMATK